MMVSTYGIISRKGDGGFVDESGNLLSQSSPGAVRPDEVEDESKANGRGSRVRPVAGRSKRPRGTRTELDEAAGIPA
jgi:hypothetical protein